MWKFLFAAAACAGAALAQPSPTAFELANLREDVRGLTQRVGELSLRVEQLERENNELRSRASSAASSYVTLNQLNDAIDDVNRVLKNAIASSKQETLQHVATQMEKLGQQTNAALESLAKAQGGRATVPTFSDNFPKEGVSYTVQKGDTLAVIAKRFGAKTADIVNANKLADPDRLVVGQTLFIPGGK